MKRIAFFGGSFDPPHRGHLTIAKTAADHFALDQILFAPAAAQPLKEAAASFPHRYAMTALAVQADPRFLPSLLDEPQPARPNYTVDTLARLRTLLPGETSLFTLLGADSWLQIAQWHHATRLLSLSNWIVAARRGFSLADAGQALPPGIAAVSQKNGTLLLHHLHTDPTTVDFLFDTDEEVSATELRHSFAASSLDPALIPAAVREYIRKTGLYRAEAFPRLR